MNQKRFDELAKGLATKSFSRRQVLRSFVVGAVLATPLSALWNRQATAQTPGCVDPSCAESAQEAYERCIGGKGRCKKPKKKCRQCQKAFGSQMLACGCLTIVNSGTDTEDPTYAPCEDPCTAQTLYDQANQNVHYAALIHYLTKEGFALDVGPNLAVFQEDGSMLLSSRFLNPARPDEAAGLHYYVEVTGDAAALAVVVDEQQQTVLYTLVANDDGQVHQVASLAPPAQTSQQRTVSTAAAGTSCNSVKLSQCRDDAALDTTAALLACGIPCVAGLLVNPVCDICLSVIIARYLLKLRVCIRDYGCDSEGFCTNDVCCPAGETGCGGSCCTSDKSCCDGSCTNTTEDTSNCGNCGEPCGEGFNCIGGSCTCPMPGQVCERDDGKSVCITFECEPPLFLNGNCECQCSTGQSAFSIQSGEPALGAMSAQATQASVICCDEGLEPCGDSGDCCAPGGCTSSGQCCPQGQIFCQDTQFGDMCVDLNNGLIFCGSCDNTCPAGQFCENGSCTCPQGQTFCQDTQFGDICVNLSYQQLFCGSCDNACSEEQSCENGSCVCLPGRTLCSSPDGDICVDLNTDPTNCGSCGNVCDETRYTGCESGKCKCHAKICPRSEVLDKNCDCVCPEGTQHQEDVAGVCVCSEGGGTLMYNNTPFMCSASGQKCGRSLQGYVAPRFPGDPEASPGSLGNVYACADDGWRCCGGGTDDAWGCPLDQRCDPASRDPHLPAEWLSGCAPCV